MAQQVERHHMTEEVLLDRESLLARRSALLGEVGIAHQLMMETADQLATDRRQYGCTMMRSERDYAAAAALWHEVTTELDQVRVDLSWAGS